MRDIEQELRAEKEQLSRAIHHINDYLMNEVSPSLKQDQTDIADLRNELAKLQATVSSITASHPAPGGGPPAGAPSGATPSGPTVFRDFVVVRPVIEHQMLGVVMGRGGKDELGCTFWGQTELSVYDDSMHGFSPPDFPV